MFVNDGRYVAKSWIVCYDEGYPLRLISSGSVFGGKCLSTSDVLYTCFLEKNISLYCVISLANFRLLFNLLLIRPSTARGSGTSIFLRWSLQKLTSKQVLIALLYYRRIYS